MDSKCDGPASIAFSSYSFPSKLTFTPPQFMNTEVSGNTVTMSSRTWYLTVSSYMSRRTYSRGYSRNEGLVSNTIRFCKNGSFFALKTKELPQAIGNQEELTICSMYLNGLQLNFCRHSRCVSTYCKKVRSSYRNENVHSGKLSAASHRRLCEAVVRYIPAVHLFVRSLVSCYKFPLLSILIQVSHILSAIHDPIRYLSSQRVLRQKPINEHKTSLRQNKQTGNRNNIRT